MKTETKWIILGILTTGCQTGYEIKNLMDASFQHFWKMSYGQIYPALKVLVEEGYATQSVVRTEGAPEKKQYTITPAGRRMLHRWLETPIHDTSVVKNELLVKLFFGTEMTRHQAVAHLEEQAELLQAKLDVYERIKANICNNDESEFWMYTLNYGKEIAQAELLWCQKTKGEIKCKSE